MWEKGVKLKVFSKSTWLVHWGLGNRTGTVTEIPLRDSLNVQIVSVQHRDPFVRISKPCTDIETQ